MDIRDIGWTEYTHPELVFNWYHLLTNTGLTKSLQVNRHGLCNYSYEPFLDLSLRRITTYKYV